MSTLLFIHMHPPQNYSSTYYRRARAREESMYESRELTTKMEAMNQDDNTLIHISHLHALHLTKVDPTDALPPPECHGCRLRCTGSSIYRCAPCRYMMHPECARMEKMTRHPAHPAHPLSLQLACPYENGLQVCNACQCNIDAHSFSFHCELCQFDLHLPCAALPDTVTVAAHPHPLRIIYKDPFEEDGSLGLCDVDVCKEGLSTAQWFYWCKECDFVAHAGCAAPGTPAKDLYPKIDVEKMLAEEALQQSNMRAEEEAAKTVALLQQYQQMSALISTQSSMFARNTAAIAGGMQSMALRAADDNLAINFNKPGTEQENRKREEFYAQRRSYSK